MTRKLSKIIQELSRSKTDKLVLNRKLVEFIPTLIEDDIEVEEVTSIFVDIINKLNIDIDIASSALATSLFLLYSDTACIYNEDNRHLLH